MFQFFWTRSASIWISILYMALGLPLLLFPGISGTIFVWALSAGAAVYAAWALVCGLILFGTIRSTIGLRVDRRIEEDGLDYYEHGETSYNS